jgi:biotin carboxyl carrier protein
MLLSGACSSPRSPSAPTATATAPVVPTTPAAPVAPPTGTAAPGAWLTAAPFDLTLVAAMSRFRSCTGHDFSGFNIGGEAESARSMKHYVTLSIPWTSATVMNLYSPFDGTVTVVRTGGPPGQAIDIESDAGRPWMFFFAHVTPIVRVGDRVKAGDLVATVPPVNFAALGPSLSPTVAFDTGLESVINGGPAYESYFLHMTEAVLAQFAARGFTPERLVVPKATRDAAPCTEYNRSDAVDYVRASGS